MEKYKYGFKPNIAESELEKRFRKQYVFACDMGDLFGDWVPKDWILKVLKAVRNSPSSYFLFLTKNPKRYFEFLEVFPKNLVLGATIETNREYKVSSAPTVTERYEVMARIPYHNKMVSIEPIMDFDLDVMIEWLIKWIQPEFVSIGADSKGHNLPEPPAGKVKELIQELQKFTEVKIKDNLKRILGT